MISQNVKTESSSLGQNNEPNPAQTVVGKDISNPLMGGAFPKSLIEHLSQQIVEILKKDFNKEVESESPRSKDSSREKDSQD